MSIVATGGRGMFWPYPFQARNFGTAQVVRTLDAINERIATIFQIPADGTCVGCRVNTATVTTGATVTVRLVTVDATTGEPTTTLYHANATASLVINNTDDDAELSVSWTGFTVTQGDVVALDIVAPGSGTFDIDFVSWSTAIDFKFPYIAEFTGTWAKDIEVLAVMLEYDSSVLHPTSGLAPYNSISNYNIDTGTTPDEVAAKFVIPFGARVVGFWATIERDGDVDVILRDSGDVALATLSIDKDIKFSGNDELQVWIFDTAVELTKDATYRLCFLPTSLTNIQIVSLVASGAAALVATETGENITTSTRVDAGAWTDLNEHLSCGLLLDGIDIPVGGAGMTVHPGMSGGMRG